MSQVFKVFILLFLIISCAQKQQNKTIILKIGTVVSEQDPMVDGLKFLKKNLEERSQGRFVVELYPSSALGTDEDLLEQAKVGANIGVLTDGGRYSFYEPLFGVFTGPYLISTYEEVQKLAQSQALTKISKALETKGIKILSFNFYQGARHLVTKKPIKSPADLAGVRIRVPGAPIMQKSLEAMGANPVTLSWSEVYPGLQQRVIDGAEAQVSAAVTSHLYEVAGYYTKTGHFQLLTGLSVSSKWFSSLPKDLADMLIEEAFLAGEYASQLVITKNEEYEKNLSDNNMLVSEIDTLPFQKLTDKVYDNFPGFRELKNTIIKEITQ